MKLKQLISLIIVVAALVAAGVFAYMTITGANNPDATTTPLSTAEILPNGSKLDFEDVNKFNKNGKLFKYPAVVPTEIGVGLNDAMLQTTTPTQ
mgnify:CR=1 FL=1